MDISEKDSYVVDVFRVAGGKEHTRFLHGHFGGVTPHGLMLAPAEEERFGQVMRNFRRDAKPTAGWSADFKIEDRLKYLPPGSDVHLRHTDLTRGTEAELAEAWVAVGMFGGTADAWIPSVLVRRQAEQPPLASTFVSVLEPYERNSNLAAVRRLELQDGEGKVCLDGEVGIEVRLADGRQDVFISKNVEAQAGSGSRLIVERESGARFDGELCLIQFNAAKQPERLLFCHGQSLRVGALVVRAKRNDASFEIDLGNKTAQVVAGSPDAVELIQIAGAKVWPK